MMKLQIALDLVDTNTALKMVEKIQDIIDIVEIGTPMIVKEGMAPVKAMKEKFPQVTVLADVKIADGGAIESAWPLSGGRPSLPTRPSWAPETPPTKRDEKFMWICSAFPMWWRVQKSWTPWG